MEKKLYKLMNWPRIEGIIYSEEERPCEILGPHAAGKSILYQAFFPGAQKAAVVFEDGRQKEMERVDEAGFFACLCPGRLAEDYVYEVTDEEGGKKRILDAYRYHVSMGRKEADKWNAGIFYNSYDHLGAHFMEVEKQEGVFFAVWAPNAVRVSVVGDFNGWDGRCHPMNKNEESGIFELFIPDIREGDCYKYEVKSKGDVITLKADPYAFGQELRPDTASVVRRLDYQWKDEEWRKAREKNQDKNQPVSVYELYLGSFRRNAETGEVMNYRELAPLLADYAKEMGYTHVELMPVMEHPLDASWGYQVIGYYAPTSRYGTGEDLMFLIDTLHQAGIGVILDWVPAHFPKDIHGLANFDGTCLYEHKDPRQGMHPHWGTLLYNYGRPQVSNYLISNALFWVEKYHADGIRMDAVASMLYLDYGKNEGEWIPNIYGGHENLEAIEFLKHLNSIMKKRNPGIFMIAEESTAWPKITGDLEEDGLGFDMKWNMGLMNDYLSYISLDPYFRGQHHQELTFSMLYQYSENFMNVFSHDEVVHGKSTLIGKMPGNREDKFANLRLTLGYMMTHPGKKLLFMGQDIAEFDEFDETRETEWGLLNYGEHKGINQLMKDLNFLYRTKKPLFELDTEPAGFEWINCISPERSMLSYLRKGKAKNDLLLIVANFAGVEQTFKVGVPLEGKYKELLHTDYKLYGGNSAKQTRAKKTAAEECDGRPFSISVKAAPLSLIIYSYTPFSEKEKKEIAHQKELAMAQKEAEEAREKAESAKQAYEGILAEMEELKKKAEQADREREMSLSELQAAEEKCRRLEMQEK